MYRFAHVWNMECSRSVSGREVSLSVAQWQIRCSISGMGVSPACKSNMLRVKPKLPGAKTGSHRFPDATGGMDSGFSSCTAPAFCRSPGILKIGRYMHVLRFAGKLQGRRIRREGFRRRMKTNIGVARVKQFLEAEVLRGGRLKSRADGE